MKKLIFTALFILILAGGYLAASHTDTPEELPGSTPARSHIDNEQAVRDAGRQAALRALACDSASHERVDAILAIRATAKNLRDAGMPASAGVFLAGASEVIDSIGL